MSDPNTLKLYGTECANYEIEIRFAGIVDKMNN